MIPIVQVFPYIGDGGCSVRIGRGLSHEEPLDEKNCIYFDFVESVEETKHAIRLIENLSKHYRKKQVCLRLLCEYLKKRKEFEAWFVNLNEKRRSRHGKQIRRL